MLRTCTLLLTRIRANFKIVVDVMIAINVVYRVVTYCVWVFLWTYYGKFNLKKISTHVFASSYPLAYPYRADNFVAAATDDILDSSPL